MNTGTVTRSPWSVYPQIVFLELDDLAELVDRREISNLDVAHASKRQQIRQRPDHRKILRQRVWYFAGPPQQHRVPAGIERALDVVLEAVADHHRFIRLHVRAIERGVEDAAVRLHVAVLGARHRHGDDVVEREVLAERVEAAMRIRDQADGQPALLQRLEHRRHVVVHLEVVVHRPLLVDLARHVDDVGAAAAHLLDDRRGVVDEDVVRVDLLLDLVEDERRCGSRLVELRRIDLDAARGAGAPVSLGLKRRPGIDQREIDVEENCTN